jgi:hypothetical protein
MDLLLYSVSKKRAKPEVGTGNSATASTPVPTSTTNATSATIPFCRTCKKRLEPKFDKHKTKASFWTNCKTCRDKQTAAAKRKVHKSMPPTGLRIHKKQRTTVVPTSKQSEETTVSSKHDSERQVEDLSLARLHQSMNRQNGNGVAEQKQQALTDLTQELPIHRQNTAAGEPTTVHSVSILEQNAEDRECSVCAETYLVQDFPSLLACSHEPTICHACFLSWLDQCMASTIWERFFCPASDCDESISHSDVQTYASFELFTRYVCISPFCELNTLTRAQIRRTLHAQLAQR